MRKTTWIGLTASVLVLALLGAGAVYVLAFQSNTPAYEEAVSVKIPPDAAFEAVVDSLSGSGILASTSTFSLFARLTGWGSQIKAGHYKIDAGVSNYDLLSILRRGLQEPIRVTIPPGSRPEVVAAVVAKQMGFTADAFLAALKDPALAQELATDTTHLFGYMLPDTYFFYWLTDERRVIAKVKDSFDAFVAAQQAEAPATSFPDLSKEEMLRMASIVEWETSHVDEKARVAGVYLNRLRDGWPLQADPTVQYAILEQEGAKRRLFYRDYDIEHPYNTYTYRGLPPGPVTNPSRTSVASVIKPEEHRYFFFVARGDGTHNFSRTLREHNQKANEFRRLMQQRRAAQSE